MDESANNFFDVPRGGVAQLIPMMCSLMNGPIVVTHCVHGPLAMCQGTYVVDILLFFK